MTFGKHIGDTFQYVLRNDPDYSTWIVNTARDGGNSSQGLTDLASYLVDNSDDVIPDPASRDDCPFHPSDSNPLDTSRPKFKLVEKWWDQDDRIRDAEEIFFNLAMGSKISLSALRGKFFHGIDPGHTNMLGGILFYLDYEYNLFTVGNYYEFKKLDYYQTAAFNHHKKKEDKWMHGLN